MKSLKFLVVTFAVATLALTMQAHASGGGTKGGNIDETIYKEYSVVTTVGRQGANRHHVRDKATEAAVNACKAKKGSVVGGIVKKVWPAAVTFLSGKSNSYEYKVTGSAQLVCRYTK